MAFSPGNPLASMGGKAAAAQDRYERRFYRTVLRACKRDQWKRVNAAVERTLDLAASGERWAVEFFRDTLDGKPAQAVNLETGKGSYVILIPGATETAQAWEQSIVAEQHQAIAPAEPVAPPKADELP